MAHPATQSKTPRRGVGLITLDELRFTAVADSGDNQGLRGATGAAGLELELLAGALAQHDLQQPPAIFAFSSALRSTFCISLPQWIIKFKHNVLLHNRRD